EARGCDDLPGPCRRFAAECEKVNDIFAKISAKILLPKRVPGILKRTSSSRWAPKTEAIMPDVSNRPRDSKNAQPSTNGRRYLGSMAAFLRHLLVSRDGYDEARQIAFQHFVLDFHEVPLPSSDPEKALYERVAAVIRTTHDFSLTWE